MMAVNVARIPLYGESRQLRANISVMLLPGQDPDAHPPPLLVSEAESGSTDSLAQVQLLEGREYRYQVETAHEGPLSIEPRDLFHPDDPGGRSGRLRTNLATGRVRVQCFGGTARVGQGEFEVRSRKLVPERLSLDVARHSRGFDRVANGAFRAISATIST